jgi:hypothetical protein
MATQIDPKELDLQAQMASIRRDLAEIAERQDAQRHINAEIEQRQVQTKFEAGRFYVSAVLAAAGLLGAGAAIGGLIVNALTN